MIKNYLKCYLCLFLLMIGMTVIFSIFNYYFLLSSKVIKLLIPIISVFISSFMLGRKTKSKAYLEGIKFSSVYIILSFILSLIIHNPFTFKLIFSYMILMLSSIVGATIGINLNKK